MSKIEYPVLCGGTFFTLVLEARKPSITKRAQSNGIQNELSEKETLYALVKILYPEFKKPRSESTFKTNISDYKICKNNGGNFPFNNKEVEAFDKRIKNNYNAVLSNMIDFINKFIEIGGSLQKDEWLVKAILDLLECDKSIKDDELFYVCGDGKSMTKTLLLKISEIYLPAFLLGIWHFAMVNRRENTIGKDTIDEWCPKNNSNKRKYIGKMGDRITQTIHITNSYDAMDSYEAVVIVDNISKDNDSTKHDESQAENKTQIDSENAQNQKKNAFVFQQFGNNNTQFGHIENFISNKN